MVGVAGLEPAIAFGYGFTVRRGYQFSYTPITWQINKDSNLNKRFWRPLCYHYIIDPNMAPTPGLEPGTSGLTVRYSTN